MKLSIFNKTERVCRVKVTKLFCYGGKQKHETKCTKVKNHSTVQNTDSSPLRIQLVTTVILIHNFYKTFTLPNDATLHTATLHTLYEYIVELFYYVQLPVNKWYFLVLVETSTLCCTTELGSHKINNTTKRHNKKIARADPFFTFFIRPKLWIAPGTDIWYHQGSKSTEEILKDLFSKKLKRKHCRLQVRSENLYYHRIIIVRDKTS